MAVTGPPPEANHTWGGFSTATWEGDMLRIKTTHLKEDYIRRDGAMASDQATVTSFWIRRGDILTWINIVHDPGLSVRAADSQLGVPPQRELAGAGAPCTSAYEGLEKGNVPHYLPGENPFLKNLRQFDTVSRRRRRPAVCPRCIPSIRRSCSPVTGPRATKREHRSRVGLLMPLQQVVSMSPGARWPHCPWPFWRACPAVGQTGVRAQAKPAAGEIRVLPDAREHLSPERRRRQHRRFRRQRRRAAGGLGHRRRCPTRLWRPCASCRAGSRRRPCR